MDIRELIDQKKQQIAKLQAQVDLLQELAGEFGRPARGRPRAVPSARARGRRGGRAARGANQQRVLAVLGTTPMRAKEIASGAGLSAAATNQVLMGLQKKGAIEKVRRGLYKAAAGYVPGAESRAPRAARRGTGRRSARRRRRSRTA
jgi:predicted Rossmann fold nucleotide-binding protein DprA/Smf involved in DNA uptake